jgi:hypothetical protein
MRGGTVIAHVDEQAVTEGRDGQTTSAAREGLAAEASLACLLLEVHSPDLRERVIQGALMSRPFLVLHSHLQFTFLGSDPNM